MDKIKKSQPPPEESESDDDSIKARYEEKPKLKRKPSMSVEIPQQPQQAKYVGVKKIKKVIYMEDDDSDSEPEYVKIPKSLAQIRAGDYEKPKKLKPQKIPEEEEPQPVNNYSRYMDLF